MEPEVLEPEVALKKIRVIRTGNGCKVIPATRSVDPGDTVRWLNLTGAEIAVFLPRDVNSANGGAPTALPIAGAQGDVTVAAGTGVFFYQVFCSATNSYAEGNSDPIIIID
jgi:plastocyanin